MDTQMVDVCAPARRNSGYPDFVRAGLQCHFGRSNSPICESTGWVKSKRLNNYRVVDFNFSRARIGAAVCITECQGIFARQRNIDCEFNPAARSIWIVINEARSGETSVLVINNDCSFF